ncbi:MAG: hypothetical protein AB4290_27200, partial [Spirulina sp.]
MKFTYHNRRNPCPICNSTSSKCRSTQDELVLCMTYSDGNGDNRDYKFLKLDNSENGRYRWLKSRFSSHLPNGELPITTVIPKGEKTIIAPTEAIAIPENLQGIIAIEGILKPFIAAHHFDKKYAVIGAAGGLFESSIAMFPRLQWQRILWIYSRDRSMDLNVTIAENWFRLNMGMRSLLGEIVIMAIYSKPYLTRGTASTTTKRTLYVRDARKPDGVNLKKRDINAVAKGFYLKTKSAWLLNLHPIL